MSEPTPAQLIAEFIGLRAAKKQHDKQYEELAKLNFTNRMEEIQGIMLEKLNAMGTESMRTNSGTAYKKDRTSVTVADAREFRRHVIGAEDWDAIEWRVSATSINDRVGRGEPIPPGVNRSVFVVVNFRSPTES
jgi:hypothetical protein